jgi:hypothetical protein
MKTLTIYTAIIIVLGAVALLAGCGSGHATAGVEQERGDGDGHMQTVVKAAPAAAPVKPISSNAMAMVRRHSPSPGFVVRWPSKVIAINSMDKVVLDALPMLAGLGIRYAPGKPGGIRYMGYSTARNSVGWSRFSYRNGRITTCEIWLNPRYIRKYNPAKTLSHELLHCTGFNGHTAGPSRMHRYGKGVITRDIRNWAKALYSLRPGSRI